MNATTTPRTVAPAFAALLHEAARNRKFVRIEYKTDLDEFIRTDALLKAAIIRDDAALLVTAMGDEIPFSRVISLDGQVSPDFPGFENYACAC
jgi:hypothetical protein